MYFRKWSAFVRSSPSTERANGVNMPHLSSTTQDALVACDGHDRVYDMNNYCSIELKQQR